MDPGNFGYKMLHKMGWKEGNTIGKNPLSYRKELHTIEPRAPGLGLGALSKQNRNENPGQEGETNGTRQNDIKAYDTVYVVRGRHKGVKGVLIRAGDGLCLLEVNEEQIAVPRDYISKEDAAEQGEPETLPKAKRNKNWLFRNISVIISSKTYKNGSYYRKKGKVVDFFERKAYLVLENGEFVENIKEKYLEPVAASDSLIVYVTEGPHKGTLGEVLAFDDSRQELTVESKEDHAVFKVPLSMVADYED